MDRAVLEKMLGDGLSLAEIGRRVGRHESTVAYWLAKYGLRAVGRERHAPKGPLRREELATLVEAGLSSSQIADAVGRTRTTVRHWLRVQALWLLALYGDPGVHHVVPDDKRFSLSHRGVTRSIDRAREEASRCVLLCANCHAEVEAGLARLAPPGRLLTM